MPRLINTCSILIAPALISAFLLILMGCQGQYRSDNESLTTSSPNAWQTILPKGQTTCSDGSEYKFFVRNGSSKKLLVYLQGGGACWVRKNCDPNMQPTYSINLDGQSYPNFGIFNLAKKNNPFKDHSIVFAPYCTGDVHIGARDSVYKAVEEGQNDLIIRHQGRANMEAILSWTFANIKAPKDVFVTGSSAGAMPSPLYTSIIADHYTGARVAQLGDGAGGYRSINQETKPHERWGTFDFINKEKGFEALDSETMTYESLYIAAARRHPEILFAAYDSAYDAVQRKFLALGGVETIDLLTSIKTNQQDIRDEVENFRSFIAGGESHTILRQPEFYTWASRNTGIRNWVTRLAGFQSVDDIECDACQTPHYIGGPLNPALQAVWDRRENSVVQQVAPFKIFDNIYYVGIEWVAAYLIDTGEGLVLIDSLYGKWIPLLLKNISALGFSPGDIKYVINTHGHFDHAGGSAYFQKVYGARIVMTAEDWDIARAEPDFPQFYMSSPDIDIVAEDGDTIALGDNIFELFNTPGHTTGVLSIRYKAREGDKEYTAMTLGGVGLNFSGVARTETYIRSYERLQSIQEGTSVSLPNHQAMAKVFMRRDLLGTKRPPAINPFIDPISYKKNLAMFLSAARSKLILEKAGKSPNTLEALTNAVTE